MFSVFSWFIFFSTTCKLAQTWVHIYVYYSNDFGLTWNLGSAVPSGREWLHESASVLKSSKWHLVIMFSTKNCMHFLVPHSPCLCFPCHEEQKLWNFLHPLALHLCEVQIFSSTFWYKILSICTFPLRWQTRFCTHANQQFKVIVFCSMLVLGMMEELQLKQKLVSSMMEYL